jgi:hypothetical protein
MDERERDAQLAELKKARRRLRSRIAAGELDAIEESVTLSHRRSALLGGIDEPSLLDEFRDFATVRRSKCGSATAR